MNPAYNIDDASKLHSPSLLFFKELIQNNIDHTIAIAGDPTRLRPHVKTHKTREVAQMEVASGITKHKCATLAEAEMLAGCGITDILLAYPLVGPNCGRMAQLAGAFPQCEFSTIADHPIGVRQLSEAFVQANLSIDVLIDIDAGQHRTGISAGPEAVELYQMIADRPGLNPGGFHVYDGHNHQESREERQKAVEDQLKPVLELRRSLDQKGLPVPRLVLGGTPTFPIYAAMELPGMELSPGTCILNDHGYGSHFPDLEFPPAALLLTRVVSRPTPNRITLDLGYKAVASDPPAKQRCRLLNVPGYAAILQNEEHLVVETPSASDLQPGDVVYAMPYHICPTSALHRFAYVVESGKVTGQWEIAARDRMLTI